MAEWKKKYELQVGAHEVVGFWASVWPSWGRSRRGGGLGGIGFSGMDQGGFGFWICGVRVFWGSNFLQWFSLSQGRTWLETLSCWPWPFRPSLSASLVHGPPGSSSILEHGCARTRGAAYADVIHISLQLCSYSNRQQRKATTLLVTVFEPWSLNHW